jgi:hypothetical protein
MVHPTVPVVSARQVLGEKAPDAHGKALIATDPQKAPHQYHSELCYALTRAPPPDHAAAEAAMTAAIARRNAQNEKGWPYYELRRARDRIVQDENFQQGRRSDPTVAEGILADLEVAFKEAEKWPDWLRDHKEVSPWIVLNKQQARFTRG